MELSNETGSINFWLNPFFLSQVVTFSKKNRKYT